MKRKQDNEQPEISRVLRKPRKEKRFQNTTGDSYLQRFGHVGFVDASQTEKIDMALVPDRWSDLETCEAGGREAGNGAGIGVGVGEIGGIKIRAPAASEADERVKMGVLERGPFFLFFSTSEPSTSAGET